MSRRTSIFQPRNPPHDVYLVGPSSDSKTNSETQDLKLVSLNPLIKNSLSSSSTSSTTKITKNVWPIISTTTSSSRSILSPSPLLESMYRPRTPDLALAWAEERTLRIGLEKKLALQEMEIKKMRESKLETLQDEKRPWRKILYEEQGYPDNFTSSTFLDYINPRVHVSRTSYWKFTKDTITIIQRISVLVLFLTVFYFMFEGVLNQRKLLLIDAISIIVVGLGIIIVETRTQWNQKDKLLLIYESIKSSIMRLVLLTFILFAVSPVLATLTSRTSNDTICAFAFLLAGVHLALHDYNYIANAHLEPPPSFEGTISFNAAIFLSVLLASRLTADLSVFAFMLFAFEVHGGFPVVAHHIRRYSEFFHQLMSLSLVILSAILLYQIKSLLALIYGLSVIFIFFVCPFWLKRIQRYKTDLHGPWDYDDEKEFASDNL